jgi:NADH-quinone oxidoreductase subunit E
METGLGGILILVIGLAALYGLWRASGPGTASGDRTKAGEEAAGKAREGGHALAAAETLGTATGETPDRPAEREPEPAAPEAAPGEDWPVKPEHVTFHETPPAEVDDLKKIKGIGPKMEAVLNEHGIYQYAQLAAFDAADLAWLDRAVGSFPGRAERDGWVAQAKELASGKGA